MPWSAGTFTRTYGSTGWQGDNVAGTPILADRHDTNDQDLATGINACINKDGSNSMTANLNMGGFIPTNLGAGTAAAPAICPGNDQDTGMFGPAANTLAFGTNAAERMRIDNAGNVGIGETSPARKLVVSDGTSSGDVRFRLGDNTNQIELIRNGSTDAFVRANKDLYLDATGTSACGLRTNGANRLFINSSGNIGIGTNSPSALLQVGDGTGQKVVHLNGGLTNVADGAALYIRSGASTHGAFGHYSAIIGGAADNTPTLYSFGATVFFNVGAERMRISASGEVLVGGATDNGAYNLQCNGTGVWGAGAYVNGSDERIKEEIQPLEDSLDIINQLNPVTFKYKEDWSKDRSTQAGFIAQEVNSVLSEEIYKDGIVQEGNEYFGLAYQSFIPLLVKAIQELSAKLDELTDRVAALEA